MPSPPRRGEILHHPVAAATLAGSARSTSRCAVATMSLSPGSASRAASAMCQRWSLSMCTAPSRRQQVEGRDAVVVERRHRPAIAAVGLGVLVGARAPRASKRASSGRQRGVARRPPAAAARPSAAAGVRGGTRGGVLLADQRLRLGRPGHDLGVEQRPVGGVASQKPGLGHGRAHAREHGLGGGGVGKKARPVRV